MNGSKRSWNRYWTLGSLAVIFAAAAAAMAIGRFTIAPKELAAVVVVADPLYRQVCPAHRNIVFVDFPHEACSGRMYHSIMRPFVCAPDDPI